MDLTPVVINQLATLLLQIVLLALHLWEKSNMRTKGETNAKRKRTVEPNATETTDPTSDIGGGDFAELPREFEPALGAVVRVCVMQGGYFGLSVTDDGGSAKLTVRTKRVTVERRFYKFTDLSAAIAKVFASLRQ